MALYQSRRIAEAVLQLREAVRLAPNNVVFVNRLAWVLATCPEASIRNGTEAVRLAQWPARISQGQEPTFLGTLAAAHAEAGDFAQAIEAAERAVTLASARGDARAGRRPAFAPRALSSRFPISRDARAAPRLSCWSIPLRPARLARFRLQQRVERLLHRLPHDLLHVLTNVSFVKIEAPLGQPRREVLFRCRPFLV